MSNTVEAIMEELRNLGSDQIKKIFLKHGAREPFFGVKVEYLKKILKREKKNYNLALDLYATGNSDAMYLAGLMADEKRMTPNDLQRWAKEAYWYILSDFTVAWVTAESPHALNMGLKWIDDPAELVASAGWATLSGWAAITPDAQLDLDCLNQLLDRVAKQIATAPNRVRYTMNGFVIAIGCYVLPLTDKAAEIAQKIGKIHVNMGDTACKVPLATEYIKKIALAGKTGHKRKMARC
ncbi:MAG: DNA alkylation repair protein [Sphingobacteriales bacterium]|nr:DNA alkylation repair protein [Sphingobacteriales bacterium]MBK7527963.1 DNA alkylation repair protein [Sphingobacteriales bacterium]MBK8678952.1 DNA alkylation repair protein [Sphingobacteriales bacterium]MBP9141140.1 DNA alkylation repair protein [Chitinophagales bacterium]